MNAEEHLKYDERRKSILPFAAQCLGLLGAIALIYFANSYLVFDFENAGFGKMTASVVGRNEYGTIHCTFENDSHECEKAYKRAGTPPAVLWLGNSQLSGVNRFTLGEKSAPEVLHEAMRGRGRYVVTYGFGGATLFEHAIVFESVVPRYNLETIVLPVVFNNFRDSAVREKALSYLADPRTRQRIAASPLAGSLQPYMETRSSEQTPDAQVESFALRFERFLNSELSKIWTLWDKPRSSLRTLVNYAYHMGRQRALGINAQTKRSVISGTYPARLRVFRELLQSARKSNLQVVVYIPPYRGDVEGPYIKSEYIRFKTDIESIANQEMAHFHNIESLVPGTEWGMIEDYVFGFVDHDFMHFAAGGHVRLANAVEKMLSAPGH
jgi:hypothetical protein